jgi:predicted alpha/beta-hydrolase family hydrolase
MTEMPHLTVDPAAGPTRAVVLVLPGGAEKSTSATSPRQLPARRMRPFATGLAHAGYELGLAAWTLHYRYRGWNGEQASPLPDIGWALDRIRDGYGDVPVALLGHSMGGRAALRAAGDPSVRAVAAFAPWLPDGEPTGQLAGRRILIAHGSLDRVTSPRASRRYAEQATTVTKDITWQSVPYDTHAMLLRFATWQRLAIRFTLTSLDLTRR